MLTHPENHLGSFLFLLFCSCRLPIWISKESDPRIWIGKDSVCQAGDTGSIPGPGRSPRKEMATHPSILAWEIPWTEKSGRLQSMGSQRVRHDLGTKQQPQPLDGVVQCGSFEILFLESLVGL